MEFLHFDWLRQILRWQKPIGCFGRMYRSELGKLYKGRDMLEYAYLGEESRYQEYENEYYRDYKKNARKSLREYHKTLTEQKLNPGGQEAEVPHAINMEQNNVNRGLLNSVRAQSVVRQINNSLQLHGDADNSAVRYNEPIRLHNDPEDVQDNNQLQESLGVKPVANRVHRQLMAYSPLEEKERWLFHEPPEENIKWQSRKLLVEKTLSSEYFTSPLSPWVKSIRTKLFWLIGPRNM